MTRITPFLTLMMLVLLSACGAHTRLPDVDQAAMTREAELQRELALKETIRLQVQLLNPAFQVRRANVDLCGGEVSFSFGFVSVSKTADEFGPAAVSAFDVSDNVLIAAVASGSPADLAGIRKGDRVTQINHQLVGGDAAAALKPVGDAALTGGAVTFHVKRISETFTVDVAPVPVCGYPVELLDDQTVNAFADGDRVMISKGMVRFVDTEDELALVIGHELAHNTEGHTDKKMGNAIIGAIFDGLVAGLGGNTGGAFSNAMAGVNSQDFESEADYVGAYYAARAGYDVSDAAGLWRRMAASNPQAIHLAGTTHPSTAKRFLALEEASKEILQRMADGEPLVPVEAPPDAIKNDYPGGDD
ncbi:M48 family metallopeptidase [Thalassospira xiamenensis]|uniref:M48 family metallopeptidase n=1 Tax=Thalassospira xiamenensis TaxID=220697 RepID=UPI001C68E850|nr:M48 family metallopeptidase [Thalassospira xiamenensis]